MPPKAIGRSKVNWFPIGIFDPFHPIALPPSIDGTFPLMLLTASTTTDYDSFLLPKETTTSNGLETSPSLLILLGFRIHDDTKGFDGYWITIDPATFRGILCARHGVLLWVTIGNGIKIR